MKKTFIVLIVILLVTSNLFACKSPSTGNGNNTIYDTLNDLAKKEYKTVEVTITTNTNGLQLQSSYGYGLHFWYLWMQTAKDC